jgi:hypothetical protein
VSLRRATLVLAVPLCGAGVFATADAPARGLTKRSAARLVAKKIDRTLPIARKVTCKSARSRSWTCTWTARGRAGACRGKARVSRRARVKMGARHCARTAPGISPGPLPGPGAGGSGSPPSNQVAGVTGPPALGFNDNAVHMNQVDAATDARLTSQVGARITRITFDWRWAEPRPGELHLAEYDALYQADLARGINPIFVLAFAPTWALGPESNCNQSTTDCHYAPGSEHMGDWRNIAALVATRYPKLAAIEIWNEPNLHTFWQSGPDPARYANLLANAYDAIKAANAAMTVLGGAVTDTQVTVPVVGDMSESDFLTGMYAAGAKAHMDGIALHPYPSSAYDGTLTLTSLDQARTVRGLFGDSSKPLWVTEVGISTTSTRPGFQADEDTQATDVTWFWRTLSAMSDVRAVIIHTLIDPTWPSDPAERGFGVMHSDLTPKHAYCALALELGSQYRC